MEAIKSRNEALFNFLLKNLTADEFNKLHETMGIGKKKLTRLKSGYDAFDMDLICRVSKVVPEMSVAQIVLTFRVGHSTLTIDDMNALVMADGNEMQPVPRELADTPHAVSESQMAA